MVLLWAYQEAVRRLVEQLERVIELAFWP